MTNDKSHLSRTINPMPDFVKQALIDADLMQDFNKRPAYQQNDYLGWINRAKKESTRLKRLQQMLTELQAGGVYMNMSHPASDKTSL